MYRSQKSIILLVSWGLFLLINNACSYSNNYITGCFNWFRAGEIIHFPELNICHDNRV